MVHECQWRSTVVNDCYVMTFIEIKGRDGYKPVTRAVGGKLSYQGYQRPQQTFKSTTGTTKLKALVLKICLGFFLVEKLGHAFWVHNRCFQGS